MARRTARQAPSEPKWQIAEDGTRGSCGSRITIRCVSDVAYELLEHVWAYIRGDVSDREFRSLIKDADQAEPLLGADLYLAIWMPDIAAHASFEALKDELLKFARANSPFACRCRELANLAKVPWSLPPESGEDPMAVMKTLRMVKDRGLPVSWVHAHQCTECRQWWLVAEDYDADAYYLRRLDAAQGSALVIDGRWPSEFETASAMRLARGAAREVPIRFARPD